MQIISYAQKLKRYFPILGLTINLLCMLSYNTIKYCYLTHLTSNIFNYKTVPQDRLDCISFIIFSSQSLNQFCLNLIDKRE